MTRTILQRRRLALLSVVACAAAGVSVFLLANSAGASDPPQAEPAAQNFAALSDQASVRAEPGLQRIPALAHLSGFHVLAQGLGRFNSRIVAGAGASGRTICYALQGATDEDPGVAYCYQPRHPNLPPQLAGQRFHALAPEAVVDGKVGVQLFGIAMNDVVRVRAQVSGQWLNVPLSHNAFYLDLPGVHNEDVGIVEATLRNGSTQTHDIQAGF